MTNLKYISWCILFIFLFTACSSDDDTGVNQPQNKIRVSTIKEIFEDGSSANYDITYNDDGNITSIKRTANSGSNIASILYNDQGQFTQKGGVIYNYNEDGLLSEIIGSNYTSEITYNAQGQLFEEETSVDDQYTLKRTFSYNSNGQLTTVDEYFVYTTPSGAAPYRKHLISYDNNGNGIKAVGTTSVDGTTYTDRYTSTFSYDDKKNPLLIMHESSGGKAGLSYSMDILNFYTGSLLGDTPIHRYYGKNNMLSRTTIINNEEYKQTFQHNSYNEDEYPLSTTLTVFGTNGQISGEVVYEWGYEKK
ncbi:hypothetical protein [Aquimarina algiphila]|uniref:hypothetical protein n=1 Tax=Aquimarina algiphila TaxID=2047982 RepID=UPI00232E1C8A|nr:hypothetical protein [Aquimarina algiphila]